MSKSGEGDRRILEFPLTFESLSLLIALATAIALALSKARKKSGRNAGSFLLNPIPDCLERDLSDCRCTPGGHPFRNAFEKLHDFLLDVACPGSASLAHAVCPFLPDSIKARRAAREPMRCLFPSLLSILGKYIRLAHFNLQIPAQQHPCRDLPVSGEFLSGPSLEHTRGRSWSNSTA